MIPTDPQPDELAGAETGEGPAGRERLSGGPAALVFLFALSGAAGLIYQVIWTRMLSAVFGNTTASVTTVLACFMGGLALGSGLLGRVADRLRRPVRMYALLEAGIGLYALLVPRLFAWLDGLYPALYRALGPGGGAVAARILLGGLVLLVPTTLMGGTLPVLARALVRTRGHLSRRTGLLYAANTAGAIGGALAAGFILIERVGLSATMTIAVILNLGVAAVVLLLPRGELQLAAEGGHVPATETEPGTAPSARARAVLFAFAASGLVALAYEVLWARLLVIQIGTSIYSFTLMLVVFLSGIALGSAAAARVADREVDPVLALAWVEAGIGLASAVGFLYLSGSGAVAFDPRGGRGGVWLLSALVRSFLALLPSTLLMGATFPLAVRAFVREVGRVGNRVGTLYMANTVGAIAGALIAGFLLIPLLGTQPGFFLLVLANLTVAAGLASLAAGRARAWTMIGLALAAALSLLLAFTTRGALPRSLLANLRGQFPAQADRFAIDYFAEDVSATVALLRAGEHPFLTVNGQCMTTITPLTAIMAHLPMAVRPEARSMAVLCFGMGVTYESALLYPLSRLDAVDLCPSVYEAFRHAHGRPPTDRAGVTRRIVDDGRSFLSVSPGAFDAITIDPPPPLWSAGTVHLFTREFYSVCARALAPQGVLLQWLPLDATLSEIVMLMKSFQVALPHALVLRPPGGGGLFLLGSNAPLDVRPEALRATFGRPEVRADVMSRAPSHWRYNYDEIFDALWLDEASFRRVMEEIPPITDDFPLVEFPLLRSFSPRPNATFEELNAWVRARQTETSP